MVVVMKYLAFGLLIALLLDATVIRMFLVPAVMKLLGDDCWWAPKWMKRVQERIGLGEVELPDERKRPVVRESDEVADPAALVGAGAPTPAQHDPGHPAIPPPGPRGTLPPPRPLGSSGGPSTMGTTRIPTAPPGPAPEPPTTRFAAQPDSAATSAINAVNAAPAERAPRVDPSPARERREIESWLGELRGGSTPTTAIPTATPGPRPSAESTRAIPDAGAEPTTAIPAQQDPESTEKIDTRDTGETPTRRGGGVSAADLLRREGRL